MVVLAALLPARGEVAHPLDAASYAGIALLFFLHGARLSRSAILAGLLHWKLQLLVLGFTFGLFPLVGLALEPLAAPWLPAPLVLGYASLCALPSTVPSSIASTSMARGKVAATVCSASVSNLGGVFVMALLLMLLPSGGAAPASSPLDAIDAIVLQFLLPFLAGHLLRPWIGAPIAHWRRLLGATDRGTILLVVYVAFSESSVDGLWQGLPADALAATGVLSIVLLGCLLTASTFAACRWRRSCSPATRRWGSWCCR